MFSAIDSSGTSASSWWMMMMPVFSLSAMVPNLRSLPSKMICAVIGAVRIDAGQHLHQRRLAGAVLADHGVDLAGHDR